MMLGPGNSMEKVNKFMGDGIFMKKGDFFDSVEDDGSLKDSGIK